MINDILSCNIFSGNEICDAGAAIIGQNLSKMQNLTHLNLNFSYISYF
jgi:hypothetical protein